MEHPWKLLLVWHLRKNIYTGAEYQQNWVPFGEMKAQIKTFQVHSMGSDAISGRRSSKTYLPSEKGFFSVIFSRVCFMGVASKNSKST